MLKLLAVDAHGPLVALGDTDLVSAALNLLTRVLSGVHVCGIARKRNKKTGCVLKKPHFTPLLSAIILHLQSQIPNLCSAQPAHQSELSARLRAALHYFTTQVFLTGPPDSSVFSAPSL